MNKKFLYQPTSSDDLNNINIVVRKSSDRAAAMINFCQEYFGESFINKTFLDLGCSYGYFMNEFIKHCKDVVGIEIKDQEINMSKIFYPEISNKIIENDIIDELSNNQQYDIVAFMNIFHTLLIQNSEQEALSLLQLVDQQTKDIMFFEMGQDHEEWYQNILVGWNVEKIHDYILENTSFNYCRELLVDSDSIGNFEGNFGRTLFVFYRNAI